jgi:hypothetical protein
VTKSPIIDHAITLAEAEGIRLVEVSTGWSKVLEVAHMDAAMPDALRSRLAQISGLRAWSTERTPHNKAEAGFTDDVHKVSITFPA